EVGCVAREDARRAEQGGMRPRLDDPRHARPVDGELDVLWAAEQPLDAHPDVDQRAREPVAEDGAIAPATTAGERKSAAIHDEMVRVAPPRDDRLAKSARDVDDRSSP